MAQGPGHRLGPNPALAIALGALYAPLANTFVQPVVRAPLFVCVKTPPKWTQIDIYPNVAALSHYQDALKVSKQFEQTYTTRHAPQVEVFPNIAAFHPPVFNVSRGPIEPSFYPKSKVQLDITPNVAAKTAAVASQPRAQLDLPVKAKLAQVPELFKNIAAKTETVPVVRSPFYTPYKQIHWPAPDVLPNIAANVAQALPVIRAPFIMAYKLIRWTQPDHSPNVAVAQQQAAAVIRSSPEPYYYRRKSPPIDLMVNVALALQPAAAILSDFDDLPRPKWTAFDLYPNIAASVGPPPQYRLPLVEPVYSKRYPPQIDVLPNVAVRAPIQSTPLIAPIDPWIAKRYAPQVEVFQNFAIYVPIVARKIPAPIDPTVWLKPNQQPYELPNIAARSPTRVVKPHWIITLRYRNFTIYL